MLDRLSPELLLLVQKSLDSLADLHALIAASPSSLRTFETYRNHVLSTVLKHAISFAALPSALAILQLKDLDLRGPQYRQQVVPRPITTLLDTCFSGTSDPFPEDESSFTRLRHLYVRAMKFADDYATRALQVLSEGDDVVDKVNVRDRAALRLSPTERGRLLRAFFRFDLYCRIFKPQNAYDAAAQRDVFLLKLRPFEVEELTCVHHYFSTVVGKLVDQLEDQFVEEVLAAAKARVNLSAFKSLDSRSRRLSASSLPGAGAIFGRQEPKHGSTASGYRDDDYIINQKRESPPLSPAYAKSPRSIETNRAGGDNMPWVRVEDLELCGLDLFSSIEKNYSPRYISFMVSLGTDFMHTLINADSHERRTIILNNSPGLRPFLLEAIDSIPLPDRSSHNAGLQQPKMLRLDGYDDSDDGSGHDDEPCQPNYGWAHLRSPSRMDDYIGDELSQAPLRARAWVFWDKKRIVGGGGAAYQALSAARRMDYDRLLDLYDRSQRRSGEERLSGVRLPQDIQEKILDKYASTMPPAFDDLQREEDE